MAKIAWITDSTSGLTVEEAAEHGIFCVPLYIIFDEKCYRDGIEMTNEEFYTRIRSGELTKTSQPALGDFTTLYEKLKGMGYEKGIAVHLSSGLSGTLQTSLLAAELTGFEVEVIDSKLTSYPMVQMILDGKKLEQAGKNFEEITAFLKEYPNRIEAFILLNDLQFLHRGGRMNAAQYLIGNLLQVKPILHFLDGKIGVFEKVRTSKKAKKRIFEVFAQDAFKLTQVFVVHTDFLDEAMQWKEELKELYSNLQVTIARLGPVLGVHGGPSTIGLTWIRKTDY